MRVTSELAPFRWPEDEAGEARFDAMVAFVGAAARRLEPSFDVDLHQTDHQHESKDYDYTLDTWRHGTKRRVIVVTHRNDYVEMGAVTGSADTVEAWAEGLGAGLALKVSLVRGPRDPSCNCTLTLEAECPREQARLLRAAFRRHFKAPPVEEDLSEIRDFVRDPDEAERIIAALQSKRRRTGLSGEELDGILREARGYLRPHGWKSAITHAKRVLRYRDDPEALFILGVAHGAEGQRREAEVFLRAAVARLPEHVDAWYNLGVCLAETERPEAAAECFAKVVALDPDNHPGFAGLARACERLGRTPDAIAAWRRAAASSPNPGGHWGYSGMDFTAEATAALARLGAPWTGREELPPIPSGDAGKDLLRAIAQRDLTWAAALLAAGAPIEVRGEWGRTPLQNAVVADLELTRFLLEHGADPNAEDGNQNRPLSLAVHYADEDRVAIVRLLLEHGADPRVPDPSGEPLILADACMTTPELLPLLADAGADPKATLCWGETGIMVAARCGSAAAIRFFDARGVALDARDSSGRTALMIAEDTGHDDIARLLHSLGGKARATEGKPPPERREPPKVPAGWVLSWTGAKSLLGADRTPPEQDPRDYDEPLPCGVCGATPARWTARREEFYRSQFHDDGVNYQVEVACPVCGWYSVYAGGGKA